MRPMFFRRLFITGLPPAMTLQMQPPVLSRRRLKPAATDFCSGHDSLHLSDALRTMRRPWWHRRPACAHRLKACATRPNSRAVRRRIGGQCPPYISWTLDLGLFKTGEIIRRVYRDLAVHPPSPPPQLRWAARGLRISRRHDTAGPAYRCFLPDLTGFASVCCVGSNPPVWGLAPAVLKGSGRDFNPA